MYTIEEAKNTRLEFWERFENYAAVRRRQKGKPAKFIMNRTGIKQLKLKFDFNEQYALVGIDIETKNMDKRLELFEKLEQVKPHIEKALGQNLIWNIEEILENGKSISRVALKMEDVNIYEKECWDKVFPFFFKKMMKLEDFFEEFQDFLKFS